MLYKFSKQLPLKALLVGAAVAGLSLPTLAQNSTLLGTELTVLGSNPKASKDGMIPAWTGGITKPPAGYQKGGDHIDPYANDNVLFTITAANMDKYADRLAPGIQALLKKYPNNFKMPVYPSRRSCALPEFVYEETRKNADRAKLVEDGNDIANARVGVPFPVPQSPVEIYWNHNFHYHGHRLNAQTVGGTIYPNGNWTRVSRHDKRYNFYADPQASFADIGNKQFYWMGTWSAPARFNGMGFSMVNTINQVEKPRYGFFFRPDQRKVVRSTPAATTHDGPLSTSNGLRNNNNMFVFSGSPDRFNWTLKGKRELYVPYNAYKASNTEVDAKQLLKPYAPNPDFLRYELHRVWEIEAVGKPKTNPAFQKRVFYADEDSWIFLHSDLYDKNDSLVRVHQAFTKNYYETPACVFEFDVIYDLASGMYNIDHAKFEDGPANLDDPDIDKRIFGSSALRRAVSR